VRRRRRGRPPPRCWRPRGGRVRGDGARWGRRPPTISGATTSLRTALGIGRAAPPRPATDWLFAPVGAQNLCRRATRATAATDDSRRHGKAAGTAWRRWGGAAEADHRLALGARGGTGPTATRHAGVGDRRRPAAPRPAGGEHLAWVGRRRRSRPPPRSWRRLGRGTRGDGSRGRRQSPTTSGAAASRRCALGVGGAAAPCPATASLFAPGARDPWKRGRGTRGDGDAGGGGLR